MLTPCYLISRNNFNSKLSKRWIINLSTPTKRYYGRPGKYSSMLDMGGAPRDHKTSMNVHVGKNNKIKAIAFDFDLITRAIDHAKNEGVNTENQTPLKSTLKPIEPIETIKPDVDLVENLANLLNVNLGVEKPKPSQSTSTLPMMDIRSKYHAKLSKRVEGGLVGVERQKEELEAIKFKGDASTHLAARASAVLSGSDDSASSRWLAATGTGQVLMYATTRSILVALLPIPAAEDPHSISKRMNELVKQLPRVKFDLLLKTSSVLSAKDLIQDFKNKTSSADEQNLISPIHMMVVSDRDDFLGAAKEAGMYTCRVRPKNARRGNVTTSHTVASIAEVEQILNEISGISYKAVFELGRG